MFRYRNEALFSQAVCKTLRNAGWFVQRIESGETGKGIPDLYVISPAGTPMWIELKRVHHKASARETIPWRPGQQVWLHTTATPPFLQPAITLCCFDDIIWEIGHYKVYPNNVVSAADVLDFFFKIGEIVK